MKKQSLNLYLNTRTLYNFDLTFTLSQSNQEQNQEG